jgi:VWFA-related protein
VRGYAAVLIVLLASIAPGQTEQAPVFRTRADAVTVDVSVRLDKRSIAGLAADDFRVADNGILQKVATVSRGEVPLDVTLLVDTSNSIGDRSAEFFLKADTAGEQWLLEGLRTIAGLMARQDRLQVLTMASRVRTLQANGPTLVVAAPGTDEKAGNTSLFDAAVAALMLPNEAGRRRVVIALTDGRDTTSVTGDDTRIAVVERSDAALYFVLLGRERRGFGEPARVNCNSRSVPEDRVLVTLGCGDASWILHDMAGRAAGRVIVSATSRDFVPALRAVFEDLRERYVLTYVPTGVDSVGWHTVAVTVSGQHNYEVLARRGYWRQ